MPRTKEELIALKDAAYPYLARMEEEVKHLLPPPKVYQLKTDLDSLWEGLDDIGIGPKYREHIRKGLWHLELGGPKVGYGGYHFMDICTNPEDVVDGRVTIYGKEISEIPPESSMTYGVHYKIYGKNLKPEHESVLARTGAGGAFGGFEGGMLIGSGESLAPWIRISKKMAPKLSWTKIFQMGRAQSLIASPLIEKYEVVAIFGNEYKEAIDRLTEKQKIVTEIKMARVLAMEDADVDTFYGCYVCQSLAPNHICIVTPNSVPYCGVMSYENCKASYDADPTGYTVIVPKGELLDAANSRWSGVDATVYAKSHDKHKTFYLQSVIKYPTTNCGCFEAVAFYIPEVDGIGLVNRRYTGLTPLGIPFSTVAGFMSGGDQNHGFKGTSVKAMRMKSFLLGDGGWNRIVWLPKSIKTDIADSIPEEVYDKIATEEDAIETEKLKGFLKEKKHPVVEKYWKNGEPAAEKVPAPGEDWPEEHIKVPEPLKTAETV